MTLLQIAGGQTWPNFLPILAFRPSKVIFLTSADPKGNFSRSIQQLKAASQLAGVSIDIEQISTADDIPTLVECEETLRQLRDEPIDLINLTGGTKSMSTAAHRFACARKIPSFQLDTRRQRQPFDDFLSGTTPIDFPNLDALSRQLDVKIALKAQGFAVPSSLKDPTPQQVSFARVAAELRRDEDSGKAISAAISRLRSELTDNSGRLIKKGKLRTALQNPITPPPGSPAHKYFRAAAEHGILEELDPPGQYLLVRLDPSTAGSTELSSAADKNFKLLEGIWFELAVLNLLKNDTSFSDVCWSVEADHLQDTAANSKGETDLVAFNHKTLNLHFISCKTTGPHSSPLDHIQGLKKRAEKEGGQFAKAELWIFRPKSETHRQDLENHCREQSVALRVFTDHPTP